MLGREVSVPIDVIAGSPPNHQLDTDCPHAYVEWVRNVLETSFSTVHENLKSSFKKQKRYYDSNLKPRAFDVEDMVWRWYPPKANQKLGSGWIGPYRVLRKLSDIAYEIKHVDTGKTVIVHVDHLKAVKGGGLTDNYFQSDDDEMESAEGVTSDDSESDSDTDVTNGSTTPCFLAQSPQINCRSRRGRRLRPVVRYSP
jgi:hypothetical protein